MYEMIIKALAAGITKLVFLPVGVGIIRLWVYGGLFEVFDLPNPSWPQTWGIALIIGVLA